MDFDFKPYFKRYEVLVQAADQVFERMCKEFRHRANAMSRKDGIILRPYHFSLSPAQSRITRVFLYTCSYSYSFSYS